MAERKITVAIDADTSGFRRGINQAEDSAGGLRGKFESLSSKLGGLPGIGLATAAVAGLTAGLIDAVQAAADEEVSVSTLAAVLGKALPDASDEAKAAIDRQVESMQYASSYADDQLRPAYGNLVAVVQDQQLAFALLQSAMDLATAKGIPLETAVKAVAKAADGNTTSLQKLAPELDGNALKGATAADVSTILAQKFGGVDKAAADTAQGHINDLNKRFEDIKEEVGTQLLPALEEFTDWAGSPEGQAAIADMSRSLVDLARALGDMGKQLPNVLAAYDALDTFTSLTNPLRWLADAVSQLRDALSGGSFTIPGWVQGIPGFPGGRAATGYAVTPTPAASTRAAATAPAVTVNVSGALDPDATARAIQRLLTGQASRVGRPPYAPRAASW